MTAEEFSRTELLLGQEAMDRLDRARVAVFGIGGVGGYVCEALARSGIGGLPGTGWGLPISTARLSPPEIPLADIRWM